MPYDVRRLTPDDQPAAWDLAALAFGYADRTRPDSWTSDTPGRHTWGVFDDGVLVAKAVDREQGHWFGGRSVPACGVAGVAVATERRGEGLARIVLTRLLAGARERGAVVSTLFPTTPVPYRQLGWEECGAIEWTGVPTATLAAIRMPPGIRLRSANAEDEPALQALYRDLGQTGTAMLDRCGPAWARGVPEYLDYDGVSVVEDAEGRLLGYASWDREPGYRETGMVTVDDFVVTSPVAAQALLSMLGGWAAVRPDDTDEGVHCGPGCTGHRELARAGGRSSAVDAAPGRCGRSGGRPRLAAISERCRQPRPGRRRVPVERWPAPAGPRGRAGTAGAGRSGRPPADPAWPGPVVRRGASPDLLRRAGLLAGADADGEALLQVATAGPLPQLLDYF